MKNPVSIDRLLPPEMVATIAAHRAVDNVTRPDTLPLAGIDTGGTFTDIVVVEDGRLRQCKVLSTPDDPSRAIEQGMARLGLQGRDCLVIHGTTVGTNAVLEGKGARVAYVTSEGFGDVLTLGRQQRRHIYRLKQEAQPPPIPPERCLEVPIRVFADGSCEGGDDPAVIDQLATSVRELGVESVAVNLLFSFLRPELESRIAEALADDVFVSLSSRVLPEPREYERGMATWLDALVGPIIARYLDRLGQRLPDAAISVMQSSGTTIEAKQAASRAVHLLLSGPAGGLAAAQCIGRQTGFGKVLSFDMGGTSTDVALIDGSVPLTDSNRIGRWPLGVMSVDIHTIGAGGGSIARVDEAGLLLVGPESAGASPGPAGYGLGGTKATVTDANLVLGRLPPQTRLGGDMPLDHVAAGKAVSALAEALDCSVETAAQGVIRIANEHMSRALRLVSVERGHDPAECALMSFGGAGGLHACELAELLGVDRIILPQAGGVLSALGMLASEPGRFRSRAVLRDVASVEDTWLESAFSELERQSIQELKAEGADHQRIHCTRKLALRYQGQNGTLDVRFQPGLAHAARFEQAHASLAGHRLDRPIELVSIRSMVRGRASLDGLFKVSRIPGAGAVAEVQVHGLETAVPVYERARTGRGTHFIGPAILTELASTSWIAPGWHGRCDRWGNIVLQQQAFAGKKNPRRGAG